MFISLRISRIIYFFLLSLGSILLLRAQEGETFVLHVKVIDASSRESIPEASVGFRYDQRLLGATANKEGVAHLKGIPRGSTGLLQVRYVGYKEYRQKIEIGREMQITVALQPATELGEVVVTARESFKPATAGIIGRQSINLLQPSTFSDLLALLPGGMTSSPHLAERNTIRLREAEAPISGNYRTSSIGTAFEIDGVPLNTDANMQSYSNSVWSADNQRRSGGVFNIGSGVDMRGISTDDIEEVEVLRGIPSVEHGNLVSGLVRIRRKMKATPPKVRIKSDPKSKLIYLGSGFQWREQRSVLNLSADYLDSKISPINSFENFRRLTFSARYVHELESPNYQGSWMQTLDYGGTFDNEKVDPEQQKNEQDKFFSSNNRIALSGALSLRTRHSTRLINQIDVHYSLAVQRDEVREQRYVSTVRINPLTTVLEGESDAFFAPNSYLASVEVEGRPVTAFLKSVLRFASWRGNQVSAGTEYSFSKNYGRGSVYDVTRPIDLGLPTRLRPFSLVPSEHKIALFVEDKGRWSLGERASLEAVVGGRLQVMSAPRAYAVAWKPYLDPRINVRYEQKFLSSEKPFTVGLNVGLGQLSMLPSSAYLYPAPDYYDIVELNYYAAEEKFRRIHFRTYPLDPANYALEAPRNLKMELRLDASYAGYLLSVTAFREDMRNGYRQMARMASFAYNKYDATGIDPNTLTAPPDLGALPVTRDTTLSLYGVTTNGSRTLKRGIEWQISTPRIPLLSTRFTCNGAWFVTRYENSIPYLDRPDVVFNGEELPVIGVYKNDTGYTSSSLASSIMMDTYIPNLDLLFATTFEAIFFSKRLIQPQARIPIKYIDKEGVEHPFTETSLSDPILKQLVRSGSKEPTLMHTPFAGFVNFKATKQFFSRRLGIALFVHRLISIEPLYERSGRTIRRSSTPYFGMELNIQL